MTYEIEVQGEEVDFEPIEAANIHDAVHQTQQILANKNVWASGVGPFTAKVTIRSRDGRSTAKLPVECAVR